MSVLRVGHSPDADDAFMFYPLAKKLITVKGHDIEHVLEDIQALNQRAMGGDLEVTAISAAVYPEVSQHYRILPCGASVGRVYGPVVVSKDALAPDDLYGKKIAIPGEHTTAYMLLKICLRQPFTPVFLSFDNVTSAVQEGVVDAGILIHEGQIQFEDLGLHGVLDLGKWWWEDTGLPIPLGLDMIHRRLGDELGARVGRALRDAIIYAREHEEDALDYALQFGRGVDRDTGRKFIRMYVNEDTVDFGDEGRKALETLYRRATDQRIISEPPTLDILEL